MKEREPIDPEGQAENDFSMLSEELKGVAQVYLDKGNGYVEAMRQIMYLNDIKQLSDDRREVADKALADSKTHEEAYKKAGE